MTAIQIRAAMATLLCAWCAAGADSFRIAGVVVNAETGGPLPHAYVAVTPVGATTVIASLTSGNDGRFAFDLPQGKYELHAGTRSALEMYGRRAPDAIVATSVITGPGQNTGNLVFRSFPTGGISGKIVDESGDPVEGALVQLVRSTILAGQREINTFGWAHTDDRGEYRFGRLLGSTYYLAVTGKPWHSAVPGRPAFEPVDNAPPAAYAPVYYPNALDKSGATAIVLKSGEERRAEFTLRTLPGVNIRLTYDEPVGLQGRVGLISEGIGNSDGFERQVNVIASGQTLAAVAPGRYLLRVGGTRGNAPVWALQPVDVAGTNLELKIKTQPAPSVSGAVQWKNAGMKPRGTVLVALVGLNGGGSPSAAVRPDGTFSFSTVWPGKYRVMIRGTDGYFASNVRVEGAEYRGGIVDLAEGTSPVLRITGSNETGRVQGWVMRGEQAAEGMMAVLVPVAQAGAPLANHGFQTDSDGTFDYKDIPAGDYFLFAVENTLLEYSNADVVRPYLNDARRIHIEPHGSYSERIPISPAPGQ